jgi:glycolate oxidase FAD binding subunit
MGSPLRSADVVVLTRRINRLREVDERNLTATAEAGMSWSQLELGLHERGIGYEIPLDPPLMERITVGGLIATGVSGPRWILHGSAKNLLLGVVLANAKGEILRFGGKTVKNVTGLDVAKFAVGSMGQLGVILEATFRMTPLAESTLTVLIHGTPKECWNVSAEVLRSSLHCCAVCWLPDGRFTTARLRRWEGPLLAVRIEGSEKGVRERRAVMESLAGQTELEDLEGEDEKEFWRAVGDFPLSPWPGGGGLTLRILAPPAACSHISRVLEEGRASSFLVHVGVAEIWAHWDAEAPAGDMKAMVEGIRKRLSGWDAKVVVISAPLEVRREMDVWDLGTDQLRIIKRIKEKVDPRGVLSPGRFG